MSVTRIAAREARMAFRDGALPRVLVAIVLLMAAAGYGGARWQRFRLANVAAVEAQARERAALWVGDARRHELGQLDPRYEKPNKPYFVYAFFPQYATVRPTPLGALSVGQTDLYAYYAEQNAVSGSTLYHEEEIQNPAILALGRFDPAFFLVVVLPVLIIAVAYDLVATDRRTGRDRLLLAQTGTLAPIVALRALVRYGCVLPAVLAPLAAVVVASSRAAVGVPLPAADVVFSLLLVSAYAAFWFALALVVNARGDSAVRNAVVLLAAWGALALLAPAAIDEGARAAYPVGSGTLAPAEERRLLQSIADSTALARLARLEQWGPSPSAVVTKERGWVAGVELRRDTVESRRAAERATLLRRQRLADALALLSPALTTYRALAELAGASVHHVLAFEADVGAAARERARATRRYPIDGRPPTVAEIERIAASALRRVDAEALVGRRLPWGGLAVLWGATAALAVLGYVALQPPRGSGR